MRPALFLLFSIAVAAIIWFAVISSAALPDHRLIHGVNDLFFHVVAFTVLTVIALVIWKRMGVVLVWLFAGSVLIEVIQIFLPSRSTSLGDIIANAAGILIGATVFVVASFIAGRLASREQQS